jgi:hypothetical protein
MPTESTARRDANDRRRILRELRKPENQGKPAAFLNLEPERGRAHLVIHQGAGPDVGWTSISMDGETFNRFRAGIINLGPMLTEDTRLTITPAGLAALAAAKKGRS